MDYDKLKRMTAYAERAGDAMERDILMPLFTNVTNGSLTYKEGVAIIATFAETRDTALSHTIDMGGEAQVATLNLLSEFFACMSKHIAAIAEEFSD